MPPPSHSSLDPVNDPAFSPIHIADVPTFSGLSSAAGDAVFTTPPTRVVPTEFLAYTPLSTKKRLRVAAWTTQAATGMMTSTIITRSRMRSTAITDHNVPPKSPAPNSNLSEPPSWVVHVLAGLLSFLLVVATVLFLAQFPPRLTWLPKVHLHWRVDYNTVPQQDVHELDRRSRHGRSYAVDGSSEQTGSDERIRTGSLRRRRPTDLTIDTSAHYRGLGIAVLGDKNRKHALPKHRSYDEESLRIRPKSPAKTAWDSFTAPLPSVKVITNTTLAPGPSADRDVETGLSPSFLARVSTPEIFDPRLRYYNSRIVGEGEGEQAGSALVRMINGGIYNVTDRLARTFYDQVSGSEKGLLLPVREEDREKPLTEGVFVE